MGDDNDDLNCDYVDNDQENCCSIFAWTKKNPQKVQKSTTKEFCTRANVGLGTGDERGSLV